MGWARFLGLVKATQHSVAVTAATDILSSTIQLAYGREVGVFRVSVSFDGAGAFSARVTKSATTVGVDLNGGTNLTANALYTFDLPVHTGDTVNFRYSATATMLLMRVQELEAATE